MRHASKIHVVLGLVYLTLGAVVAQAAPPPPGIQPNSLEIQSKGGRRYRPQKPTVSPYVALTPGGLGNIAAINFFNVVQPEIQQLQINQQQFDAVQKLEGKGPGAAKDEGEELDSTILRERAGFMTHHKYFAQPINRSGLKKDKK